MEDEELISRRDRLRQEREERHRIRQERHSAPGRFRLRAMAVVVVAGALVSWLLVSWFGGSSSSPETLPDAPELSRDQSGQEQADEGHAGQRQGSDEEVPPGAEDSASENSAPDDGPTVVHVAGAVESPGVVEVPAGARVHEAIEEAGGPTEEAALHGLNLAEEVQDGVLVWVPTQEEYDAGEGPPADQGQQAGGSSGTEEGQGELINLNTADAAGLEGLPGIGPALAERIVDHRESHGDFGSLEELAAVSGIGPAILADVEDLVTW